RSDAPRRVESRGAEGAAPPPRGWAIGYRPDGAPVAIGDDEARLHVAVCGSTGSCKTTVLRPLLDAVAGRCPVVVLDCKASPILRRAVDALPGSVVWSVGGDT